MTTVTSPTSQRIDGADLAQPPPARRATSTASVNLSVIAMPMVAFVGETVVVDLQVELSQATQHLELLCAFPTPLQVQRIHTPPSFQAPQQHSAGLRAMISTNASSEAAYDMQELIWSVETLPSGTYHWQFETQVAHADAHSLASYWGAHPPSDSPALLDVEIEMRGLTAQGESLYGRQVIQVTVYGKSRWLRYLPSLYQEDELMGRWLIAFERLWQPIEQQISLIDYYFDAALTPPPMLRWLASWISGSAETEIVLSNDQLREWLRHALSLYRRRGTRQALQELLALYTNGQVEITEMRAANLVLGKEARLGVGVALGKSNQPHTFHVRLHMPRPSDPQACERRIRHLIESEKPAHTTFSLEVTYT